MPPSLVQNVQCHSTLQCCDVSLRQVCVSHCPQAISACEKCQHWKWALMLMEVGKWTTIISHLISAWNGTHLENCYSKFFCLYLTLSRFLTTQMLKPKSRFTSSRRYRLTTNQGVYPSSIRQEMDVVRIRKDVPWLIKRCWWWQAQPGIRSKWMSW